MDRMDVMYDFTVAIIVIVVIIIIIIIITIITSIITSIIGISSIIIIVVIVVEFIICIAIPIIHITTRTLTVDMRPHYMFTKEHSPFLHVFYLYLKQPNPIKT